MIPSPVVAAKMNMKCRSGKKLGKRTTSWTEHIGLAEDRGSLECLLRVLLYPRRTDIPQHPAARV